MGYRGFKISDAARFCGFSPQGLRLLEDRRIAAPHREKSSGYRFYNLWEIGRILRVKILRSFGLTLDETLLVVTAPSVDAAHDALLRQEGRIVERMRRDRATLLLLQKRLARIASISQRLGCVTKEFLPAYYQIVYARLDECVADAGAIELIRQWNELAPLTHSMPTFHWNGEAFEPLWSTLGAFEEDVRDCELLLPLDDPRVCYHEACPALYTVFRAGEALSESQNCCPDATPYSLFTAYLEEHDLRPAGDCVLYPLLTTREEESYSYYCCWLPYEGCPTA